MTVRCGGMMQDEMRYNVVRCRDEVVRINVATIWCDLNEAPLCGTSVM